MLNPMRMFRRRKAHDAIENAPHSDDEDSEISNSSMDPLPEPASARNGIGILVMGLTGAGKSTFISRLAKEHIQIGHSLGSCTTAVDGYRFRRQNGQQVWLIDTPGFDDTSKANAKVLREIVSSICAFCDNRLVSISGLIYIHRITDVRMSGSSLRSIRIFEELCGEDCFDAVTVVTSMWDVLQSTDAKNAATERESMLKDRPQFFGRLVGRRAHFTRLQSTVEGSRKIVEDLAERGSKRSKDVILAVEQEMRADRTVTLAESSVGKYLLEDSRETRQMFEAKIIQLETYRRLLAHREDSDDDDDDEDLQMEVQEQTKLMGDAQLDMDYLNVTWEQMKEERTSRLLREKDSSSEGGNRQEKSAEEVRLEKALDQLKRSRRLRRPEDSVGRLQDQAADQKERIRLEQELSQATASRTEWSKLEYSFTEPDFWGWVKNSGWNLPKVGRRKLVPRPRHAESLPSEEPREPRHRDAKSSRSKRMYWEKKPSKPDARTLPSPNAQLTVQYDQQQQYFDPEQYVSSPDQETFQSNGSSHYATDQHAVRHLGTLVPQSVHENIPHGASLPGQWSENGPSRSYPPEVPPLQYCTPATTTTDYIGRSSGHQGYSH